jgi:hypothetical protein
MMFFEKKKTNNFKMLQPFQDCNKNIDAQPFFPGELRYEGFFLGG